MKLKKLKFGIIGGGSGLGSWWLSYLRQKDFDVSFTALEGKPGFLSNPELVRHVDVVFLCVPITAMEDVLEEIYPHLGGKTLIEICSVKRFVVQKVHRLLNASPSEDGFHFYSIHPMFSQSAVSLKGQVVLLTHTLNPDEKFYGAFQHLLTADGAFLYTLDYLRHDQIMGVVQGLNHFNVFVSAKTLERLGQDMADIKRLSSPPYRIFLIFFTRYVLQNPKLYADIQMYNEYVPEVLRMFKEEVDTLCQLSINKDREGFMAYVNSMKPYFMDNAADAPLSDHLITQLGLYLKKQEG